MTDDRINRSAILTIEFALTIDMNFGDIINIFATKFIYKIIIFHLFLQLTYLKIYVCIENICIL